MNELVEAINGILIEYGFKGPELDEVSVKIVNVVTTHVGATQEKLFDSLQMERDRSRALDRKVVALEEIVARYHADERAKKASEVVQ